MKRTILTILMLASAIPIVSCGGGGGGSSPTSPSTSYSASFTATTPTAGSNYVKMEQVSTSGDTVTIAVKAVSIIEPVGGMALDVTYDASKLSFVSASNGDAISGNTSSFAATNGSGTVVISASDVVDSSPVSSGTLFTIKFKGTTTGNVSVAITNNSLFNASGNRISTNNWYGGTVVMQ